MKTRILIGTTFLFPLLASADTLVMKDGTRFLGNFNSASATQMSFTEYNGNRQMLNMYNVQELRFGNDSSQPNDTGFGRNTQDRVPNQQPYPNRANPNQSYPNQTNPNQPNPNQTNSNQPYPNQPYPAQPTANNPYPSGVSPQAGSSSADDLERLQSDLQAAMNNNDLSDNQSRSLQDANSVLRTAAQQVRNNRPMNQRALRSALDNIRGTANSLQQRDRDVLNEDLRRVNSSVNAVPVNGGRDY